MPGLAIITEACIDVKDRACVDACPVQCIYEFDPQNNVLFSEDEAGSGTIETTHTPNPDAIGVLLRVAALEPVGHLCAAMAPCMRLYAWLGRELEPVTAADSPYREWVETYADPARSIATRECDHSGTDQEQGPSDPGLPWPSG